MDNLRLQPWIVSLLRVAGVYFMIWGISVVLFPTFWFDLAHLKYPNYVPLWQYIGIEEALLGLGYFIAASNPMRHWPIILIGFLSKLFITIGYTYDYWEGILPETIFFMTLSNCIIWLIPYGIILYKIYNIEYLIDEMNINTIDHDNKEYLSLFDTNKEMDLLTLSDKQPVLLIFLRHFGCTFCRETLNDLKMQEEQIRNSGAEIVLVHQRTIANARVELQKYGLSHIAQISDPELMLYKHFNLKRGTIPQLFGIKALTRFIQKGVIGKLGISAPENEDSFQMPGVFLIHHGEVINKYIHISAADRPKYHNLCKVAS